MLTRLLAFIRRLLADIDYNNRHQRGYGSPSAARNENNRKGTK